MKINIMNDFGIQPNFKNAFLDGILEMSEFSNRTFEIQDLGLWRREGWGNQLLLSPFNSIDWYINQSLDKEREQINAQNLMALFYCEPWQDDSKHLDLFITNRDLFAPGTNFVLGYALPGVGAVVSTKRFANMSLNLACECLKTLTMHEFGHVLGIVPDYRRFNVEESLGKHCTNQCLMRQGLTVNKWVSMTHDRLRGPALCQMCQNDLLALAHFNS